jgi:hypothetical protein
MHYGTTAHLSVYTCDSMTYAYIGISTHSKIARVGILHWFIHLIHAYHFIRFENIYLHIDYSV